jgi:hypothetical protein
VLYDVVDRYQHCRETVCLHSQGIDGGKRVLGNIGAYAPNSMASLPKRS